ncbi:hypothetical protein CJF31_00010347 [Rutstroemia sp. NJR-2017a BVV2]|nr:hypothetical protein CJF31_00010347 [Rutstroemia sp. NJR-2017a BVV2]
MTSLLDRFVVGRSVTKLYRILRDKCPITEQLRMKKHKNSHGGIDSAKIEVSQSHSSAKDRPSSWSSIDRKEYKKIILGREILQSTTSGDPLRVSTREILIDPPSLPPRYRDPRKCLTCSYEYPARIIDSSELSRRAPLSARHLDVFTYIERNGVPNSALGLTKDVVSEFQRISQLEEEVANLERAVARSWQGFVKAVMQLSKASREQSPLCTGDASKRTTGLKHMEAWMEAAKVICCEWDGLEQKVGSAIHELNAGKSRLFGTLHEALSDGNLYDTSDCRKGQSSFGIRASWEIHQEVHTASSSSIARNKKGKEHRGAVKHMKDMKFRLEEAQDMLDDWPHYYDEQYAKYCRAVAAGNMEAAKTVFDLTLLKENQEAIEDLREAEKQFERAREVVRELGTEGSEGCVDEDGDGDGYEDGDGGGYRESIGRALVGNVDRGVVDRWVEGVEVEEDIGRGIEKERGPRRGMELADREDSFDEWSARSIGFCDSVSLVAQGKERSKIDRWEERCRGVYEKGKGIQGVYLVY